jgi:hypothetical protein
MKTQLVTLARRIIDFGSLYIKQANTILEVNMCARHLETGILMKLKTQEHNSFMTSSLLKLLHEFSFNV